MPNERDAAARTIEARRRQVARLYNAGYSARETEVELRRAGFANVSRSTVYRDIAALREEWRAANIAAIEDRRARHVQRLDEDIAHWTRQSFRISDPEKAAAYWATVILPALKERAKLLGLYAPARVDITAYVRDWARRNGFDPERAVQLAREVVESTGF